MKLIRRCSLDKASDTQAIPLQSLQSSHEKGEMQAEDTPAKVLPLESATNASSDDFPEGGTTAWLVVFGGFCIKSASSICSMERNYELNHSQVW